MESRSLVRNLCFIPALFLATGLLFHCGTSDKCTNDISLLTLDPNGSTCTKKCDCSNQKFQGYCENNLCNSTKRAPCAEKGKKETCELRIAGQGLCEKGTRICQDEGLRELLWGDCKAPVPVDENTAETCSDFKDNDCDGRTDSFDEDCEKFCKPGDKRECYEGTKETMNRGECKSGTQTCVLKDGAGEWGPCEGQVKPIEEICDKKDNDCDGKTDEDVSGCEEQPCTSGEKRPCYRDLQGCTKEGSAFKCVGVCQPGAETCQRNGAWGPCLGEITPASQEICSNDRDDNCNGQINESCSCKVDADCKAITLTCQNNLCVPKPGGGENPNTETPGESGSNQEQPSGENTGADAGSEVPEDTAGESSEHDESREDPADGGVNKEDSSTREGNNKEGSNTGEGSNKPDEPMVSDTGCSDGQTRPCYTGPAGTAQVGECKPGTQTCFGGVWGGCANQVKPATEECNGKDDDCDGEIDNKPGTQTPVEQACYTGSTGCTDDGQGGYTCKGTCAAGTQSCQSGTWGTCSGDKVPGTETCDGKDEDCDGTPDNGANADLCDDKNYCTTGTCNAGQCTQSVNSGFCFIDNKCYASTTVNTANPCQKCDASKPTAWSNNDGQSCDDKDLCTYNDRCTGGTCKGTSYTCDDQLTCTENKCTGKDPNAGGCEYPLKADFCMIQFTCYPKNTPSPFDKCYICKPAQDPTGWSANFVSGCVHTIAGVATAGLQDGPGAQAKFYSPHGVALDSKGDIYVADQHTHRIRKIIYVTNGACGTQTNYTGYCVSTYAGSTDGFLDGPSDKAKFSNPYDLAFDRSDKLYVADRGNNRIRMIYSRQVITVAGDGTKGTKTGPALSAQFNVPEYLTVDSLLRVFVTDVYSGRLHMLAGAQVSSFISGLSFPGKVLASPNDEMYVMDQTLVLKQIVNGKLVVIAGAHQAGTKDGIATEARFNVAHGFALDNQGNFYVADSGNHRIRKVTKVTNATCGTNSNYTGWCVSTFAGSGAPGYLDGNKAKAQFYLPTSVVVNKNGWVIVADYTNQRIRVIIP